LTSNRREIEVDAKDREILGILQHDGRAALAAVARRVGLTPPSVNERLRKLEQSGVIRDYVARLDQERIGCDIKAFIEVFIEHPRHESEFLATVAEIDEVLECHHVTGDASVLLKVVTRDRASLKGILLDRINSLRGVRGTRTTLVLATVKEEVAVPLGPADTAPRPTRRRK